ncbi:SRPBCC family protein [Streptomyces sp. CRN 30]|uniref:SRPBCC family protein n=1 Tax=Streptomyces sp. CRN 30 TaxID=3075613 RepID=UPI002A8046FF|nr:SRPBCC family protein [Streptomyces sp. CRN 30]
MTGLERLMAAELNLRAIGPASPDTAWCRYLRFGLWPGWSPYILGVETPGDRIAPGARGTVRGPLGVRARFVIDSVDEERRSWTWRVRCGPLRMRLTHDVLPHTDGGRTGAEAGTGTGTETRLRLRGPAPVLAAYAPLARLALGRLVRA